MMNCVSLSAGFNRQSSPLMGEDIENAWCRMGIVEGYEKWPMWSKDKIRMR